MARMGDYTTDLLTHKLSQLVEKVNEPKREEKKELIILVFYIPVGHQSEAKVRTRLAEIRESFTATTKDMERHTNYKVNSFVIPTREGEAKVECIFPKEPDEKAEELMQELKENKLLP